MEVLEYRPQGHARYSFPFEKMAIMPIGDIQAGSDECDLDLLKQNIAEGMDAGAYFTGMGDYHDVASPSNRKIIAKASISLYDSPTIGWDKWMKMEEDIIMDVLKPTAGRWLGLLSGHHFWQFQDGTTTDTNLARKLETVHLGSCGLVRIRFQDESRHAVDCVIWSHHGTTTGSGAGSPISKLEKVMIWNEADIYLKAHEHKTVTAAVPRFYLTEGKDPILYERTRRLVGTGSYLKGYMQGRKNPMGVAEGTYVEKGMMQPVSLGSPLIYVTPQREVKDGHEVRNLEIKVLS